MIQFGNKHGRYAIEGRTPFLVDGSQDQQRVETLNHHLCTAMCQAVHGGQYHSETMEQRYTDTQFVVGGEFHVFSCQKSVVGDVVVGQHDAFGESRSARGVLHVHGVVAVYLLFGPCQFLVVHVVSQQQNLCRVVHSSVFFLSDVNHVAHVGEALAFHVSPFKEFQFGQHGVRHFHEVAVFFPVDDTQRMHVGVLTKILQFRLLVVRVDGDCYGPDFGTGIQKGQPVGYVAGPDAHVRVFLHSDGQQAFGHTVHPFVELFPGEAQVAVGIYDVFFVRSHFRPMLQPVAQGSFR